MKYANVRLPDLLVTGYSEDDSRDLSIFSNESQLLLPVGDLDFDTVKCIATEETYEHVVQPEQVFEPILDDDGSVISAGYTIPAVTETRTRIVYSLVEDDTKKSAKAERVKYEKYQQEKKVLVDEIYNQMELVYGSRDDIGNIAQYLTLLDMRNNPDEYILPSIGLTARNVVIAYADDELTKIRQYSKFRLLKVAQIKIKKEQLNKKSDTEKLPKDNGEVV
jgi:hypothetical protein